MFDSINKKALKVWFQAREYVEFNRIPIGLSATVVLIIWMVVS